MATAATNSDIFSDLYTTFCLFSVSVRTMSSFCYRRAAAVVSEGPPDVELMTSSRRCHKPGFSSPTAKTCRRYPVAADRKLLTQTRHEDCHKENICCVHFSHHNSDRNCRYSTRPGRIAVIECSLVLIWHSLWCSYTDIK